MESIYVSQSKSLSPKGETPFKSSMIAWVIVGSTTPHPVCEYGATGETGTPVWQAPSFAPGPYSVNWNQCLPRITVFHQNNERHTDLKYTIPLQAYVKIHVFWKLYIRWCERPSK